MQVITIHHPIDQNLKNNEGIVLALGFLMASIVAIKQ